MFSISLAVAAAPRWSRHHTMSPAPTKTKVSCSSGAAVTASAAGGIGFGDCAAIGFSAKRTKPAAKLNRRNADLLPQTGRRSIGSLLTGPRLAREGSAHASWRSSGNFLAILLFSALARERHRRHHKRQ